MKKIDPNICDFTGKTEYLNFEIFRIFKYSRSRWNDFTSFLLLPLFSLIFLLISLMNLSPDCPNEPNISTAMGIKIQFLSRFSYVSFFLFSRTDDNFWIHPLCFELIKHYYKHSGCLCLSGATFFRIYCNCHLPPD